MALLPIVQYDSPLLRKKGVKITSFDQELSTLAADMRETMIARKGIGLAAQQIGQALMLTVIDLQREEADIDFEYLLDGKKVPFGLMMPLFLANPVLKLKKGETEVYEEGCLSFPGVTHTPIERPAVVECRYQDLQGVAHTLLCDGLLSRCIQHEVDHLNGILFIDRMSKSALKKLWPELEALKLNAPKA